MKEVFEYMDTLSFMSVAGVFLVFSMVALLGMIVLCRVRCDK